MRRVLECGLVLGKERDVVVDWIDGHADEEINGRAHLVITVGSRQVFIVSTTEAKLITIVIATKAELF